MPGIPATDQEGELSEEGAHTSEDSARMRSFTEGQPVSSQPSTLEESATGKRAFSL